MHHWTPALFLFDKSTIEKFALTALMQNWAECQYHPPKKMRVVLLAWSDLLFKYEHHIYNVSCMCGSSVLLNMRNLTLFDLFSHDCFLLGYVYVCIIFIVYRICMFVLYAVSMRYNFIHHLYVLPNGLQKCTDMLRRCQSTLTTATACCIEKCTVILLLPRRPLNVGYSVCSTARARQRDVLNFVV